LNNARQLANTLADGANYAQFRGDDAEAVERIMDVLHFARSVRQDDFLVSQLVAFGADGLALDTAQVIGPGLRLQAGAAATRPATRAQVRQLIAEILDERLTWKRFGACLRIERLATIDWVNTRAEGAWVIRPLADLEMVRANRNLDIAIEASKSRNQPGAMAVLARAHWEPFAYPMVFFGNMSGGERKVPRYSRWFLAWSGDLTRYFETQFRSIGERRATAVSLAAQLYRADHDGRWPAQLDELVPAYLPAVPADPFHDDGRPLGYVIKKGGLPGGGDRPLVYYDAGEDDPAAIQDEPMFSFHQVSVPGKTTHIFRQYHDLTRFAPPTPSTQAVDDDPEKADAPRDKAQKYDPPK
jgi:hypothetical protein